MLTSEGGWREGSGMCETQFGTQGIKENVEIVRNVRNSIRRVCKGSVKREKIRQDSREMVTILIGSEGQKKIPGTLRLPGLPICFTTEYSYIHLSKYKE
jgi:hypothetical protein